LTFLILFLCPAATLFAETAGKIISVQGRAEVRKGAAAPWLPAANLQLLDNGDVIRTLAESRAVILLADETQMKLNGNTTLELRSVRQTSSLITRIAQTSAAQGDQSLLNLTSGQVWLRSRLKPANVRVNTPSVTAAVRGTEFDLKVADDGESTLTTLEGLVDFRNDQGAVLVASGEQARARIGQAPTKTVLLRPRDAVQWVLYYPGAVSPADYSFLNQSTEQLQATLASASSRRGAAPADLDNLMLLARAQHDLGKRQEAEATLKEVLAAAPKRADALTDLAWIRLEGSQPGEAIGLLNQVEPKTDRSIVALSLAYYRQGDSQLFFDTIRLADPDRSSLAATQRAFAELMYGNAEDARKLLERIPAGDPGYSMAQGLLSNVRLAQNDKDGALQAAQAAVQSGPRSPSAYLNLSLAQQGFFQIPEALRSAQTALEMDPDYVSAQVQVAKLLFASGNTGRAEQIARQGLTRNSSEPALNSLLGFILLAQAKTAEAKTYFEKSIAQDAGRGEPQLGLGIVSMRQGHSQDATASILIATTLEPQISLYQSYLGKSFYDLRRFEMAMDSLSNAATLDPRDPTPHLYAGIFDNDLSRPGNAVRELTRSIELNNNRAVYRSRFLLDEDRSTRNVNLATAYNRLSLSEWGNYEALKSQMADPSNSSTHVFLAQTFLNLPGRTQAAGSEQLVARMLLPVNANSFNSFNDYTTLFEAPEARWSVQGQFDSFNSQTGTLIASGGTSRIAYGVSIGYFTTDGFRPVNDDNSSLDGVAQVKLALTPHSDLMFLYSHDQQNGGDTNPPVIGFENNEHLRVFTRRHRGEIGYHMQFRPGSDFMLYFSGEKPDNVTNDDHFFPNLFNAGYQGGLRSASRNPDLDLQASHIYKIGPLALRYGLDIFEGRARNRRTIPCCLPQFDSDFGETIEVQDVKFRNGYVNADITVHPRLVLTGAVHYDWSNKDNFDKDPALPPNPFSKWSPQAGINYMPFDSTTLRFAYIQSMQTEIRERLAPTNIQGFVITQNDPTLSQNTSYSFGWDQRFARSSFFRGTAYYRDRNTPVLVEGDTGFVPSTTLNHFHGADLVWNQMFGDQVSLVPAYSMSRAEDVISIRHEHDASVRLFYISPRRYWAGVTENYIRQGGSMGSTLVDTSFATTDLSASYELPRKLGLITFSVTNLFDHRYTILVDPLALDPRVPRRKIAGFIRFNF
jgi:tetratricopeptide (TPR) repeat protein